MVFGWGMCSMRSGRRDYANILHCLGESEDAYKQVQNQDQFDNQSSFGHEALAGAASFGAFKIFEDRQRKEGNACTAAFTNQRANAEKQESQSRINSQRNSSSA